MSKLTQWHSGDVKPVHEGPYERDYSSTYPMETAKIGTAPYAVFKDGYWMIGDRTIKKANTKIILAGHSHWQKLPWRGLAVKP